MTETPVMIVTGATNGIGEAAAIELARLGAHVGITARNPWAMAVRVVSEPPDTNRPVSWNIVSVGIGEPSSIVALAHVVSNPSPSTGQPWRLSCSLTTVPMSCCIVGMSSMITSLSMAAASRRMSRSLHSFNVRHVSSSSRPSNHAVNRAGS